MTEQTEETLVPTKKVRFTKKTVTILGAAAVGVAVLALVVNDRLKPASAEDEDSETAEN